MIKNVFVGCVTTVLGAVSAIAMAEDYVIDTKDAHAFVQFKASHLGYSYVIGRFNDWEGTFSYDENSPDSASVNVLSLIHI